MKEVLSNILKFALQNFYPKNHMILDGKHYPSKLEKYEEWLDSTYANGGLYIGEELPVYFLEYNREILKVFSLYYEGTDKENHYGVGVVVENFKPSHEMKLMLNNDYEVEYIFKNYVLLKDNIRVYGELLSPEPINMCTISVDEIIEGHIKYSGISSTTYDFSEIERREYNEFIEHYDEIEL